MNQKRRFREGWARLAAMVLVLGALLTPAVMAVNAASSQPRDNDSNSIIWGGCYTKSECVSKMQNGDGVGGHTGANISGIYKAFGITAATLDSADTVPGTVYADGHVTVAQNVGTFKAGATVATGAWSVGRTANAQSTPFAGVYKRSVGSVFASSSITGFINMSGNKMNWFVLNSCGNAGGGTPTAAPKPSPTPTATPKPTSPPTPSPTPVSSLFSCDSMLVRQDQTDRSLFHFIIYAHTGPGVAVTGYLFSFSDQNFAPNPTDANTPTFSRQLPPGSQTIHGQVETTAGTSNVSRSCTDNLDVPAIGQPSPSPTNSPTPTPTGQVLGTTATPLPATGPETALGGVAGLTAIGVAGRAYLRSRKNLLDSLRMRSRK